MNFERHPFKFEGVFFKLTLRIKNILQLIIYT